MLRGRGNVKKKLGIARIVNCSYCGGHYSIHNLDGCFYAKARLRRIDDLRCREMRHNRQLGVHLKLLVVDDCPEIVKILSSSMELSGHSVDEAYDGMEAIELLRSNKYDVVITDAEMPRLSGIEVCKYLRARSPNVYVIGISGSFHALKAFKDAGADICFSKPFSIDKVEDTIENLFSSSLPKFDAAASF
ncbi:MAG: response regulator transcription factor [Syntrophales bacterium]